jgi:hypothetical protein
MAGGTFEVNLPALIRVAHSPAIVVRAGSAPRRERAYAQATREFWPGASALASRSIAEVRPLYVATYIEQLGRERSAPTVKQRLAAIRHLFDWR